MQRSSSRHSRVTATPNEATHVPSCGRAPEAAFSAGWCPLYAAPASSSATPCLPKTQPANQAAERGITDVDGPQDLHVLVERPGAGRPHVDGEQRPILPVADLLAAVRRHEEKPGCGHKGQVVDGNNALFFHGVVARRTDEEAEHDGAIAADHFVSEEDEEPSALFVASRAA
jgi:hypothetical protein